MRRQRGTQRWEWSDGRVVSTRYNSEYPAAYVHDDLGRVIEMDDNAGAAAVGPDVVRARASPPETRSTELRQRRHRLRQCARLVASLAQERLHRVDAREHLVEARIGALLVRAQRHEVPLALVEREGRAQA